MQITIDDLAKANAGLASHFRAAAAHHEEMHKLHKAHGEMAKAKADGMADDGEHKAFFTKTAEFHGKKADLHKAHAAHMSGMADGMDAAKAAAGAPPANKAAGAADPAAAVDPAGAGSSVEQMMKDTVAEVTRATLDALKSDPTVKEEIKKKVLEGVREAMGKTIMPDGVTAFARPSLVPRAGQPTFTSKAEAAAEVAKLDPELQALVEL